MCLSCLPPMWISLLTHCVCLRFVRLFVCFFFFSSSSFLCVYNLYDFHNKKNSRQASLACKTVQRWNNIRTAIMHVPCTTGLHHRTHTHTHTHTIHTAKPFVRYRSVTIIFSSRTGHTGVTAGTQCDLHCDS